METDETLMLRFQDQHGFAAAHLGACMECRALAQDFRAASYTHVAETLLAIVTFLLSTGPVALVWIGILFVPVRWVWRRLRPS